MSREEEHIDPALVRSKLRVFEDHNLALRLQEEEFNRHYNQNRTERRVVGSDTKTTKTEQQREDEFARNVRLSASRRIAETDEEVARRIAAEWEAEETRKVLEKEEQLRRDAELAQALERGVSPSTSAPPVNHFSHYNEQNSYVSNNVPTSRVHDMPVQPPSVDDLLSMSNPQFSNNSITTNPILQGSTYVSAAAPTASPTRHRGFPLPGLARPESIQPQITGNLGPTMVGPVESPTRGRGIPLPGLTGSSADPASVDIGSPTSWPAPPAQSSALNQPPGSTFGTSFGAEIQQPSAIGAGFSQPNAVPSTGSTVGRNAFLTNDIPAANPVSTNPFDPSFWDSSNPAYNQQQPTQPTLTMPPLPSQQSAVPHLAPMPNLPTSVLNTSTSYNNHSTNAIDSPPPAYDEFGLPHPSALALGHSGVQPGYNR